MSDDNWSREEDFFLGLLVYNLFLWVWPNLILKQPNKTGTITFPFISEELETDKYLPKVTKLLSGKARLETSVLQIFILNLYDMLLVCKSVKEF